METAQSIDRNPAQERHYAEGLLSDIKLEKGENAALSPEDNEEKTREIVGHHFESYDKYLNALK